MVFRRPVPFMEIMQGATMDPPEALLSITNNHEYLSMCMFVYIQGSTSCDTRVRT